MESTRNPAAGDSGRVLNVEAFGDAVDTLDLREKPILLQVARLRSRYNITPHLAAVVAFHAFSSTGRFA